MNNKDESLKKIIYQKLVIEKNKRDTLNLSIFKFSSFSNYKYIVIAFLFVIFTFMIPYLYKFNTKIDKNKNLINHNNKLIQENFFILDTNNLDTFLPHMFGFSISKKGILTDNYYKKLGFYEEPEPLGVFVMIRKIGNEIRINQDFYGSYGIYLYEDKSSGYFALSNSFLLLEEYLLNKKKLSLNKDYIDSLIISRLCTPSLYETMLNEIIKIPSNAFLIINMDIKELKIYYIDYKEKSIPLESEEGLKIMDNWVDKWGYIFRSLKKKTDNISTDLTGGFDSRIVLSILMNSGIDLNNILVFSDNSSINNHDKDFQIAKKISSKLGFKINDFQLDNNGTIWSTLDSFFCTIYTKLGFHKEFNFRKKFLHKPKFSFSGDGGEMLRGYPASTIKDYIEQLSNEGRKIKGHGEEFYNSSMRLCNRSIKVLKNERTFDNDYEIASFFYSKGLIRTHFGTRAVEAFLSNIYIIQPLIDPDLNKIKYEINQDSTHDLISYIYVRFCHDLINIPLLGKRKLNYKSIKKVELLNNLNPQYNIKHDYNKYFYVDTKRKSPVIQSNEKKTAYEYSKEMFKSYKFISSINKVYDINVYVWAKEYSQISNFVPLRHGYGLFAVSKIIEELSLNKSDIKKIEKEKKEK